MGQNITQFQLKVQNSHWVPIDQTFRSGQLRKTDITEGREMHSLERSLRQEELHYLVVFFFSFNCEKFIIFSMPEVN